jgi:hypothetical protein
MVKAFIFCGLLGAWAFYVSLGESPQTKIYRACYPIDGFTQVVTFAASKWSSGAADSVTKWGTYGVQWCQYGLNKTIYGTVAVD